MNEPVRSGHVSRDRLLGEGSAFVRQLTRAQQAAAHQATQLADAPQAGNDDASDEHETNQVLTFNELWNARTTANHVGICMAEFDDRLLDTHLWWPQAQGPSAHKAAPAAGTTSSNAAKHQLVQESLAHDRLLQHQGRGRGWRASGRYKSKKEYQADQELAAGRWLAATLLGDPRDIHQKQSTTSSRSGVHSASPCNGDLQVWVCCNKPYPDKALEPTRLTEAVASVDACGCENPAAAVCCQECGALRWDGPNGQLQQRLLAVMQTADLSSAGTKQLAARLTAESGSLPALGLQLQPEAVQQEVQAFLVRRRAAIAASTSKATAPGSAGIIRVPTVSAAPCDTISPAEPVTFALHPAAQGVYQQLEIWHQEQLSKKQLQTQPQQQPDQQQQQQQRHSWDGLQQQAQQVQLDDHGRLHAAAAAAAALAPQLLTSVLRECNNIEQASYLKPVRMHNRGYPVVYTWVADVLQQAAVAAASRRQAAYTPRSNSQSASPSLGSPSSSLAAQQLPGLQRPLPHSTLQQLLDRKSAVLRQAVIDCAQQIADQGKLPVVQRTTSLADSAGEDEGSELLTEEMPVKDWLWSKKKGHYYHEDCQYKSKLPAEDGVGDVPTVVRITCDDWQTVTSIRRHMLHVLTAWHQLATSGAPSAALMTTAERDLQEIQLQHWLIARWQQLPKAWGAAPVMSLRTRLAAWDAQQGHLAAPEQQGQPTRLTSRPLRQKQQDQPVQHPGSSTPSEGATSDQSKPEAVQTKQARRPEQQQQQQERSRKRRRWQQVDVASGTEQQHQQQRCEAPQQSRLPRSAAAAAGSSSATAVERNRSAAAVAASTPADCDDSSWASSSTERDSDSHSDSQTRRAASGRVTTMQGQQKQRRMCRQRRSAGRQGAASRQQMLEDDDDEHMTKFDMFLGGIDDLFVPNAAETFEAAGRPSAAWTSVGIETGTTRHARAAIGATGVRVELAGLPDGVQAVLRSAAAAGTSAAVLHRATARLQFLASSPSNYG